MSPSRRRCGQRATYRVTLSAKQGEFRNTIRAVGVTKPSLHVIKEESS
eukprot:gene2689-14901_t